jgi:hypothetical protein
MMWYSTRYASSEKGYVARVALTAERSHAAGRAFRFEVEEVPASVKAILRSVAMSLRQSTRFASESFLRSARNSVSPPS